MFFFTFSVNVTTGLVFGVVIGVAVIYFLIDQDQHEVSKFDSKTEYKLNVLEDISGIPLEYLYYDPELINLLHSLEDISHDNDAFLKCLKVTNNFLQIRKDFDKVTFLDNDYESFQLAEEQANKGLNYLHSLIYVLNLDSVSMKKYETGMATYQLLTKRNLDFMKSRCDTKNLKNINTKTRYITDYDIQKPYNKFEDISNKPASNNFYIF